MKCKCDKSISSGKNYRKIQVSNYYRHLQSAGCFHINIMKKALRYVTAVQQQSSTSIVSLSSNRAPASSIEAPISSLARPLVISDQPVLNGKRRLASKSRQHSPKRSCTWTFLSFLFSLDAFYGFSSRLFGKKWLEQSCNSSHYFVPCVAHTNGSQISTVQYLKQVAVVILFILQYFPVVSRIQVTWSSTSACEVLEKLSQVL